MAHIPPSFIDSVAAIGERHPDGSVSWIGSAFFYGLFANKIDDETNEYRVFCVTNRHVVDALTTPVLRLNPVGAAPAGEFPMGDMNGWVRHPDPDIDVAVTGIMFNRLQESGVRISYFQSDNHALTLADFTEMGLSEGDDVFLLGFPMGLVGGPRNAVIVRQGIVARMIDCIDGVSNSFLVDGYVFPGNSGGPVINRATAASVANTKSVNSTNLVGIVASYVEYTEVAVSQQTQQPRVVFSQNSGLTNVFPVDRINETIMEFHEAFDPDGTPRDRDTAPRGSGN